MYHNHHLHETKHLKEANLLQEEKYHHLTTEPVGRLVCEMAVPTIISMLVTAAYNLADTFLWVCSIPTRPPVRWAWSFR